METDFATGQQIYLATDPDRLSWTITEIKVNIDNGVKFRISNGYTKRWVFGAEIRLIDDSEPKKVGY